MLVELKPIFQDKTERCMYVARMTIPANLLMALWKLALFFVAPSLFLLATVAFNLGGARMKAVLVRTHRTSAHRDPTEAVLSQIRAYRRIGAAVLALALLYVASCLPLFFGADRGDRYELPVAIAIAAITFIELIFSICGNVTARRTGSLLVEAVRLVNLAGCFILLVLTQIAIMSFAYPGNPVIYNAVSGVLLGSMAALVGGYMLVRGGALQRNTVSLLSDG